MPADDTMKSVLRTAERIIRSRPDLGLDPELRLIRDKHPEWFDNTLATASNGAPGVFDCITSLEDIETAIATLPRKEEVPALIRCGHGFWRQLRMHCPRRYVFDLVDAKTFYGLHIDVMHDMESDVAEVVSLAGTVIDRYIWLG